MSFKNYLSGLPFYLTGIGVVGIPLVILVIILTRNAGIRVAGLLPLSQIIGVWVVFLLVGSLAREERHIQIGYFTEKLPEPLDRLHEVGVLVVNIVASLLFFYSAVLAFEAGFGSTVSGLGIPTAVYFLAPLLGFALLLGAYLLEFAELFELTDRWTEVPADDQ